MSSRIHKDHHGFHEIVKSLLFVRDHLLVIYSLVRLQKSMEQKSDKTNLTFNLLQFFLELFVSFLFVNFFLFVSSTKIDISSRICRLIEINLNDAKELFLIVFVFYNRVQDAGIFYLYFPFN